MHLLHMGIDASLSSPSMWLGENPAGTTPGSVSMHRMWEVTASSEMPRNRNMCKKNWSVTPYQGMSSAKHTTAREQQRAS